MIIFIFFIEIGINKDNEGEGLVFLIVLDNVIMGSGGVWMGFLFLVVGISFVVLNIEVKMVVVEFDV